MNIQSKRVFVIVVIVVTALLVFRAVAYPGQVVKNSYEDNFPHIKGNYLVWQSKLSGDWEIFLYNIVTHEVERITNNRYYDQSPKTDGDYVVWLGCNRSGGEIFLYDIANKKTIQITNDDNLDAPPQIADGKVVWTSYDVTESVEPGEIFLYDIATKMTRQLTHNSIDDSSPRFHNGTVIWGRADDQGAALVIYDMNTGDIAIAPEGFTPEISSQIDGDLRVLSRKVGNDREIFVYNSTLYTYQQLTDNDFEDRSPCINGENIAWVGGEGKSAEIFLNADIEPIENDFEIDEPDPPPIDAPPPSEDESCFIKIL